MCIGRSAEVLDAPAKDVSLVDLDAYLATSYGIVRGGGESKRGEAEVQREAGAMGGIGGVASGAEGAFDSERNYTLELPYRDDRELVLDILRQGGCGIARFPRNQGSLVNAIPLR